MFWSRSWGKNYNSLRFSQIHPILPIYVLNLQIFIFICIFGSSRKLALNNCFSMGFVYAICICISYLVCFCPCFMVINGNVHVLILFCGFLYRSFSFCFPNFLLCHLILYCINCFIRTCNEVIKN